MHDRSLLSTADVDDDALTAMVADLLGHPAGDVAVLDSTAEHVAYDLPSITTAGRYWVRGTALTPSGREPYRIFVKHVQAWSRSPFFAAVPPEMREMALAGVPWRTEPLAYRSDLGDRLPPGLSMPRALGVFDLDAESAAVWLEEVSHPPVAWTPARYRRAALLLGRLAASDRVSPLRDVGRFAWSVHTYLDGRLEAQVLPLLQDDGIWRHPVVAGSFDDVLRDRLRAAGGRVRAYADELCEMPRVASHGDASPNNLLPGPSPEELVLIDFGFWMPQAVGHDLGQLVAGEVQLGRGPDLALPELDADCVAAYTQGLHDEGLSVDESVVRRAHALQLLIFAGLSSLPVELLDGPPSPAAHRVAAARADLARHSLDLVEATDSGR